MRRNAKVKGRWHDNRHTLITELAETGAGDQTIMDIAGHVSKQMLKHYSHIRMEAKRSALEAIVDRRPVDVDPGPRERDAKSLHGLQNERKQARKDRTETNNEKISAADNAEKPCSETLADTRHFDVEYPQKSPQSGVFEINEGVEKRCKSMNLFGGRGRNRTYNLSVKSRMLKLGAQRTAKFHHEGPTTRPTQRLCCLIRRLSMRSPGFCTAAQAVDIGGSRS